MAIGTSYNEQEVIEAIAKALEIFYVTLIEKIDGLDIVKIMKRKNPYLYRAKAMENAKELPCNVVCGPLFSSDAFYSDSGQTETLARLGVLAVEMEAAALYMNAARAGKNALAICSISDSLVTGEELSAEERQIGFRNMMELGLSLI